MSLSSSLSIACQFVKYDEERYIITRIFCSFILSLIRTSLFRFWTSDSNEQVTDEHKNWSSGEIAMKHLHCQPT